MLVLSRRPGQKVVFPGLGVTIEVLRSRGAVTRLGITAPENIPVLRDEVLESSGPGEVRKMSAAERQKQHELKNVLNSMMLKLELLKRQLELGQAVNSEQRLCDVFREIAEIEQSTTDSVVGGQSPQILVVEDEANERELLASCLRLRGISVATAGNGREAFDFLHENALPDLVLLDMRMPEIDGPTFLKSVRDNVRLQQLRVFAVSGSSRDEFEAESQLLDGWIPKPVRIDALLQAVRSDRPAAAISV